MSDLKYDEMDERYHLQCFIEALKEKVIEVLGNRINEQTAICEAKQIADEMADEQQNDLHADIKLESAPASAFEPNNPEHQECLVKLKRLANIEEE